MIGVEKRTDFFIVDKEVFNNKKVSEITKRDIFDYYLKNVDNTMIRINESAIGELSHLPDQYCFYIDSVLFDANILEDGDEYFTDKDLLELEKVCVEKNSGVESPTYEKNDDTGVGGDSGEARMGDYFKFFNYKDLVRTIDFADTSIEGYINVNTQEIRRVKLTTGEEVWQEVEYVDKVGEITEVSNHHISKEEWNDFYKENPNKIFDILEKTENHQISSTDDQDYEEIEADDFYKTIYETINKDGWNLRQLSMLIVVEGTEQVIQYVGHHLDREGLKCESEEVLKNKIIEAEVDSLLHYGCAPLKIEKTIGEDGVIVRSDITFNKIVDGKEIYKEKFICTDSSILKEMGVRLKKARKKEKLRLWDK